MSISDSLLQGLSAPIAVSQVPEDLVPYTDSANPFIAAHEAKYKQLKMMQALADKKEKKMLDSIEESKYKISSAIKTSSLSPYRRALLTKVANPLPKDTTVSGPTGTGSQGPIGTTSEGPRSTRSNEPLSTSVQIPEQEDASERSLFGAFGGGNLLEDIRRAFNPNPSIPKPEDLEEVSFDELKRLRDVYQNKNRSATKDLPKDIKERRPVSLMDVATAPYNTKMFEAYRDAAEKKFRGRRFAGMSPDRLRFYKDQLGGFFSPEKKNLKDYRFDEAIEAGEAAENLARLEKLKLDTKIDAKTDTGFREQWSNAIQVPEARLKKLDELSDKPGYTRIPRDMRQQLDAERKRLTNYVNDMYDKSENLQGQEDAAIIAGATRDPSTGSVPGVNYGGGTFTAKETQRITQPTAYRKAKNQISNTATQGPSNLGASGPVGTLPSGSIGPGSQSPSNQPIPPEPSLTRRESTPLTQAPQGSRASTGRIQLRPESTEELAKFPVEELRQVQPTDQGPTDTAIEGPTGTVVPSPVGNLTVVPPQTNTQGPTSTTPSKTPAPVAPSQANTQGPTSTTPPSSIVNLGVQGPSAAGGGPIIQASKTLAGNLANTPTNPDESVKERLRSALQSQAARRQFPGREGRRYDGSQDWKAYFGRKYQGLKNNASDFLTDVDRVSTRLLRPITVGTQDLVSDAANRFDLVRNMLGEDSLRDLNKELYFATGDDEYKSRLGDNSDLGTRAEYIDSLRKERMARDYDYNRFVPTDKKKLEAYKKNRAAYEAEVEEGLNNYYGVEGNRLGLEDIRTDSPYRDALGYTQNMLSDPKKYLEQTKDYFTDNYRALPSPGDYYESLDDDNPLLALFGDDERTSISAVEKVLQNPKALEALSRQFGTSNPKEIQQAIQRGLVPNADPAAKLRSLGAIDAIQAAGTELNYMRNEDSDQMPIEFMDAVADIESGLGELEVPIKTLEGESTGNFNQFTNNVFNILDQLDSDRVHPIMKQRLERTLEGQMNALTPQQAKLLIEKINRYQRMQGSMPSTIPSSPSNFFGELAEEYTPELFLTKSRKPLINLTNYQGRGNYNEQKGN